MAGRHNRNPSELQGELAGLVVLVSAIHHEIERLGERAEAAEQLAARLGVGRLARRERKRYSRSSIRGNQMNLGGPSAAGFADGLWAVFFNAPVPSG